MATLIINSEAELYELLHTDGTIKYEELDVVLINSGKNTTIEKGPFVK